MKCNVSRFTIRRATTPIPRVSTLSNSPLSSCEPGPQCSFQRHHSNVQASELQACLLSCQPSSVPPDQAVKPTFLNTGTSLSASTTRKAGFSLPAILVIIQKTSLQFALRDYQRPSLIRRDRQAGYAPSLELLLFLQHCLTNSRECSAINLKETFDLCERIGFNQPAECSQNGHLHP